MPNLETIIKKKSKKSTKPVKEKKQKAKDKKTIKDLIADENIIKIIQALEKLQQKKQKPELKKKEETEDSEEKIEKEIKKEKRDDKYSRSILEDLYEVRLQQSFYQQSADYDKMYEHMGKSRLPQSHFITFSTQTNQNSTVIVEEYRGEMSNVEAESTIQKIMYLQLFGTTDNVTIEEKERFVNWRHFNKEKRRLYEALAPIKYKQMIMKPKLTAMMK